MTHLLEINNLDVKFDTDEGRITAIDNVSLTWWWRASRGVTSSRASRTPAKPASNAPVAVRVAEVGGETID